jgi:ABC-type sugar transport system ATPase subunit
MVEASMTTIELRNVHKSYGAAPYAKEVVRDCSFVAEANRLTVMIGPSGVGKSTLIRLIAGFEKSTQGEILFDGRPVNGPAHERLVVFQESALFPMDDNRAECSLWAAGARRGQSRERQPRSGTS